VGCCCVAIRLPVLCCVKSPCRWDAVVVQGGSLYCVAISLLVGGLLLWCGEAPCRWAAVVLR